MKKSDFLKLHCCETQNVEFKTSLSSLEKGIKSLSSFLNTNDGKGIIYFGINDKGKLVGLKDNIDTSQKTIRIKIDKYIFPRIIAEIVVDEFQGNKYLKISAERFDRSIYYFKGSLFLRCGSEDLELNDEMKTHILRRRYSDEELDILKLLYEKGDQYIPMYKSYGALINEQMISIKYENLNNSSNMPMGLYILTEKGKEFYKIWFNK